MSALGEYIHYFSDNYRQFGTHRKGAFNNINIPSRQQFIKDRLGNNFQSVSQETLNIIKSRLSKNSDTQINKDEKILNNHYQEKINQLFNLLSSHTIEEIGGRLHGTSNLTTDLSFYHELVKPNFIQPDEFLKKQKILKEVKEIINKINIKGQNFENQQKEIDSLILLYNQLDLGKINQNNILNDFNKIEEQINQFYLVNSFSQIIGDFGELFAITCDDKIYNLAGKELESALKDILMKQGNFSNKWVGNIKSSISINKNLVKYMPKNLKYTDNGNSYKIAETQDKVDCSITVNKQEVDASIKYYKDQAVNRTNVTLQSSINLFYSLIYLNNKYMDFGNHWINLKVASQNDKNHQLINLENNLNNILRTELAYEALIQGNPLKNNVKKANVFITISRSTGKVFVQDTSKMLLQEKNYSFVPKINKVIIDNHWNDNSEEARITNILSDLHSQQIHASYQVRYD